jgi:hypothetical protein
MIHTAGAACVGFRLPVYLLDAQHIMNVADAALVAPFHASS